MFLFHFHCSSPGPWLPSKGAGGPGPAMMIATHHIVVPAARHIIPQRVKLVRMHTHKVLP